MPGARLVPTAVALAASACCARPAPALPTPPPLAGRARTLTFECQGADPAPASFPMTCALAGPGLVWRDVDPPPPAPGIPQRSYAYPPTDPCVYGTTICGVATPAPEGSRALACRDADGRSDGPVELVAPDGSLLVQGYCAHGAAAGTWFWWERGRLASTRTFQTTGAAGVLYVKPDLYTYDGFELVPVAQEAP